ncbi:MAG: YgcG family protein [Ignavibacteria bacterium]|nr:YgcG family protein [Ignavibacteria bacterium]MBI3765623.1 YgcG family protein [Ignavibacteriales bacterium]
MRPSLLTFVLFLWAASSFAQRDAESVPLLSHRVTDMTSTLSRDETQSLEEQLAQFERETSNQIVVLIVPTMNDESIEDFSLRVTEKNKLGKKGRDNGVLLLIAKEDRKMRIEVGYGLEGSMPDAISDQIIRRVIAPLFRQGDYFGGVNAGIDAIMRATKGEYQGEPDDKGSRNRLSFLIPLLLFLMFGFFSRLFTGGRRHYLGSRGYYSSGGWWLGGFGGGGFGGGSGGFGGGGGFSGGGGSFGGGGASGSW